jgi:hypothetical protein
MFSIEFVLFVVLVFCVVYSGSLIVILPFPILANVIFCFGLWFLVNWNIYKDVNFVNTSIRHDHQNVYTHSDNGMLIFKINNIKRGRNINDI